MAHNKQALYWLILVLIPISIFALIEIGVRLLLASPAGQDPFLDLGAAPEFFEQVDINGVAHYKVVHDEAYRGRNIVFPVVKDKNAIRVFCLGGSASAGWPHPKSEIYSAYLESALQLTFSEKKVEVINVSAHAYAIYRVKMIFDQVIKFDPDIILLYSGNNEFLEPRTYVQRRELLVGATRLASQSAAYRLFKQWYLKSMNLKPLLAGDKRQGNTYANWAKVSKTSLDLRSKPDQFAYVKQHFAYNIEQIVRSARAAGVPVVLSTVPNNVRDWLPNVSYVSLSGEALKKRRETYYNAKRELLLSNFDSAIALFTQAVEMEPLHAESYFHLARAYEKIENWQAAEENYIKARDLDHNPFRAITDFNRTIRRLADEYPNAFLADTEAAMFAQSAPLTPGFDYFLDYVHPTKSGNLIIAKTMFDTILDNQIFVPTSGEREFAYLTAVGPDGKEYREDTDYRMQQTLLWLFGMMHQYEAIVNMAKNYRIPEEPTDPFVLNLNRVQDVFSDYLELQKKKILRQPVNEQKEREVREKVMAFYGGPGYAPLSQEDFERIFANAGLDNLATNSPVSPR